MTELPVPSEATPASGSDYVAVDELDRARVRVARSPLPTVFALTRDALRNGQRGTPRTWRLAALSRLRRRDAEALAPLTDPRCTGWPGLLEDNDAPYETLDEALQRVSATPGTALLEALERDPDVRATDPLWEPLRRDPDRWLSGYVDAIHRGGLGMRELWRQSEGLIQREADRIDAAVDRGATATELLADVGGSRVAVVDGQARLARAPAPRRLGVAPDGLVFAPMIGGGSGILSTPGGRLVRAAYSLPESWRAFDDQAPPPASLEALIGAQRARLLRRLDVPQTAGRLAEALHLAPSGVTFHVRAMEAAGLVTRERDGRHVLVRRTERGHALLALYERP